MVAGVEQVAKCAVRLVPGAGSEPATLIVAADGRMVPVAAAELRSRLVAGARVGALHGLQLQLVLLETDTDAEAVVEQAAAKALEHALGHADLVELEPWVVFEVLAPAASSAAVLADLGSRGGEISQIASGSLGARLNGRAPLARMLGYVTRLRSITKGLGQVVMRPDGFAPSIAVQDD